MPNSALSLFLNRLLRRSALGAEEREAILSLSCDTRQHRTNYDIVSPAGAVSHSCLIADGFAARYDQMADGQRQLTAFHIEGDMADLHSLLCPLPAWGIVALVTTTVLEVPHKELQQLVVRYPQLAFAFWRDTAADMSILAKWVGNLGRRGARGQIAHIVRDCVSNGDGGRLQPRTFLVSHYAK